MENEKKKEYSFCIQLPEEADCLGFPIEFIEEPIGMSIELSDDEVAAIRQIIKDSHAGNEDDLMPILESVNPSLYHFIDSEARAAIFDTYVMLAAASYDLEFDEEEQRQNFKKDLESGLFKPQEFIEKSDNYNEVPEDEEELFDLWMEWEHWQFFEEDVAWIRSRYTIDESAVDVSDIQYICYIPDEFF